MKSIWMYGRMQYVGGRNTVTVSAMLVLLILLIHKPCSNPLAQLKVARYTHNLKQTLKMKICTGYIIWDKRYKLQSLLFISDNTRTTAQTILHM